MTTECRGIIGWNITIFALDRSASHSKAARAHGAQRTGNEPASRPSARALTARGKRRKAFADDFSYAFEVVDRRTDCSTGLQFDHSRKDERSDDDQRSE